MESLSIEIGTVPKEADPESNSSSQFAFTTDDHPSTSIAIDSINIDWFDEIIKFEGKPEDGPSKGPKIQRVPEVLRNSKEKCFDPQVVSIGPYHHGKFQRMEKHKITMAHQYVTGGDYKEAMHIVHSKFPGVVSQARKYYDEDSTAKYDDKAFAKMMFLDACFVIQFIYCIAFGEADVLEMEIQEAVSVHQDLFLLENQLPFPVLEVLMSLRFEKYEQEWMLNEFMERTMNVEFPQPRQSDSKDETPHLLHLIRSKLVDVNALKSKHLKMDLDEWDLSSYRSAKELMSVGVRFRPSKTCCFTNVKFQSELFTGVLTLPRILVDDSMKFLLLNLVAYEACPNSPEDAGVISYIRFMNSLVDQVEDARKLRANGILLNYFESDEEVAKFFKELKTDLEPNIFAYADVKRNIQRHCERRCRVGLYEYFSRPWAAIIFSGATLTVGLTVVQTLANWFKTYHDIRSRGA